MIGRLPGLLLAAAGLAMLAAAVGQPAWAPSGRVGPGFVPQGLAAVLALLGAAAMRVRDRPATMPATLRPALLLLASVAAFALLLPRAGFLAAALAAAALAALAAPGARPAALLAIAALTAAAGAILFLLVLGLPLPLLPR